MLIPEGSPLLLLLEETGVEGEFEGDDVESELVAVVVALVSSAANVAQVILVVLLADCTEHVLTAGTALHLSKLKCTMLETRVSRL